MSEPLPPQCHECFKPLTFDGGAGLEYFNAVTGGYPDPEHPERTQPRYVCADCGPTSAYHIDFPSLLKNGLSGPNGWATHLERKRWFRYSLEWDLVTACELADDLRAIRDTAMQDAASMRSVVDSIPRRRPPTPSNPRSISTTLRARVLERDAFRCRRCGSGPRDARLVVDHIIPVAKGGTADFGNLQTLCAPCNGGKSDRAPTAHDLTAGQSL
jgi:5-methylcytosine-specific restriction enzyme A